MLHPAPQPAYLLHEDKCCRLQKRARRLPIRQDNWGCKTLQAHPVVWRDAVRDGGSRPAQRAPLDPAISDEAFMLRVPAAATVCSVRWRRRAEEKKVRAVTHWVACASVQPTLAEA